MRALCGEKSFFSPLFTANLTLFFVKTSSRARVEVSPLKIAKRCKICGEFEKKCKICVQCDECGEKKLLSGEIFFSALKRWKKIFHRYKQDAVKKNFSPLPAECGEKKFFTAKIENLTNIYRSNFNAYLIFTWNIIEVSDRWHSGLRSWSHAWGRGSNPCTAVSFL